MLNTIRAIVGRDKKIEFLEPVEIPDGTEVLVTIISEEEHDFWLKAGESSLAGIWNNAEDDVYGQLLKG